MTTDKSGTKIKLTGDALEVADQFMEATEDLHRRMRELQEEYHAKGIEIQQEYNAGAASILRRLEDLLDLPAGEIVEHQRWQLDHRYREFGDVYAVRVDHGPDGSSTVAEMPAGAPDGSTLQ